MGSDTRRGRPRFTMIYHIAGGPPQPAEGQEYVPDSLAEEGFVHCSTWRQLIGVARTLFRDRDDLVVLEIDATLLSAPVVWEDCYESGQDYPHVYGPIERAAVTGTLDMRWADGSSPVFTRRGAAPATGPAAVTLTTASPADPLTIRLLARLNEQLMEDEGHECALSRTDLQNRMTAFLEGEYTAYLFTLGGVPAGYALVDARRDPVFVRQLFVQRGLRRQGTGTMAFGLLRDALGDRAVRLEVLRGNDAGMRFWHSVGLTEHALTMVSPPREQRAPDGEARAEQAADAVTPVAGDTAAAFRYVSRNLRQFNDGASPAHAVARDPGATIDLAFMLTDRDGAWHGGVTGKVYWDWLEVDTLWVAEHARGRGHGSELLRRLEETAGNLGARHAHLTTFSFQARPFYERHGYRVVGEMEGFPQGQSMYWMRKELGGI